MDQVSVLEEAIGLLESVQDGKLTVVKLGRLDELVLEASKNLDEALEAAKEKLGNTPELQALKVKNYAAKEAFIKAEPDWANILK